MNDSAHIFSGGASASELLSLISNDIQSNYYTDKPDLLLNEPDINADDIREFTVTISIDEIKHTTPTHIPSNRQQQEHNITKLTEQIISAIDAAELTIDEYCMIAAIGSIAKQLAAFNKLPHTRERINTYLDNKGFPHDTVGAKIGIDD